MWWSFKIYTLGRLLNDYQLILGGMNFVTDVTQPDYENTFIFVLQANPKSSVSGFPGSLLTSYG